MYQPKTGDRVRVVIENLVLRPDEGQRISIELLAPAEPLANSVVRTVGGGVYRHHGGFGWYATGSRSPVSWTTLQCFDPTVIYTPDSA